MRASALLMIFNLLFLTSAQPCFAFDPSPSPPPKAFLQFEKRPGGEDETYRLLDSQNQKLDTGNRSTQTLQESIVLGQGRAQQMVDLLKDEEMQSALKKVTKKGNQILEENPDLRNPAAVIAGAFTLWAGRTFALIRGGDVQIFSRVEGRNQAGEFSMRSPLLNGRLRYAETEGANITIDRRISSISTSAEFSYNTRVKTYSGSLSHSIAPHIDFSFGASQPQTGTAPDGQAKLMYNLNF